MNYDKLKVQTNKFMHHKESIRSISKPKQQEKIANNSMFYIYSVPLLRLVDRSLSDTESFHTESLSSSEDFENMQSYHSSPKKRAMTHVSPSNKKPNFEHKISFGDVVKKKIGTI